MEIEILRRASAYIAREAMPEPLRRALRRAAHTRSSVRPMSQRPPRRYPRYSRFIWAGAIAGFIAAVVLTLTVGAEPERYSRGQVVFYVGIVLAGVGALLGGLVAVLLESRARRDARRSP